MTTGSMATGFAKVFANLKPILLCLGKILVVVGALAAAAYVLYNLSPLKKVRNEIETIQGAAEDCGRAIEKTSEALDGFNNILSELANRDSVFDNLIEGSSEWYKAIADSN
jgi:hypothetical protein